jgi:hypothetical protein
MESFFVDIALPGSGLMVIFAVLAAFVLPLVKAMDNPKSIIKGLVGIGAVAVLFLVSYGVAGHEVTPVYTQFNVDAGLSKIIGGGIIMTYIMAVVSVIGVVVNAVMKFVR